MAQAKDPSSSLSSSSEFLSPMCEVAREAGALLMDFFRQRVKVEYKGDVDVVTAADRAAEKLIFERIRSRWPKHNLMGEEGTRTEQGSDYRWYVDPLDGTTNFAHGYPVFCVSIALEFQGELIVGVIFDPTRNELYTAERGRGAFLDGEKIHVSSVSRLAESLLANGIQGPLGSGAGRALRSSLPFGDSGRESRTTKADGIMWSGNDRPRCSRSSPSAWT